ncbi:MAG: stage II sporulation protein R [Clostridia bacterium]|nr:stage II sporulation protein R [Clostridia bacterium]
MTENTIRKFAATLCAVLCLAGLCSLVRFEAAAETVRTDVVRLHILANSDAPADQAVKLAVRDAVLAADAALLSGGVTPQNAAALYARSRDLLEKTAEQTLRDHGFAYGARAVFCREYYPTRVYGDCTFPAGVYASVKIVLGEGGGHNWWCVLFPPLCVPAACKEEAVDCLTDSGAAVVSGGERYVVKFKIVEWYEALKSRLDEKRG